MDKKTIGKIKLLKSIQPNKEWSVQTREVLFSQIRAQGVAQMAKPSKIAAAFAYTSSTFSTVYQYSIGLLFERPLALVGTLSVFVVGVVGAFFYAQTSIPGDALYSMKRTTEGFQTAFVSPDDRPQLEIELADRRIGEILAVSEKKETSQEEKAQNVSELIAGASQNFENAKKSMEDTKSVSTPKKIVEIAKLVQTKTVQYEKTLTHIQAQSAGSDRQKELLTQKINSALADARATESKALQVIVDKKEVAQLSDDEVKLQIEQHIVQVQERVERIKVYAAGLTNTDTKAQATVIGESAQKALEDAKAVLEKNEYQAAMAKLDESKKIIQSLQMQSGTGETGKEKINLIY